MISLTDAAAGRIKKLLSEKDKPDWGLRVGVKTGGCSGLEYDLEFTQRAAQEDHVFESHGAKLFVDSQSLMYLDGTTLDYSDNLLTGGFKFLNPNAQRKCSCGTSFAI